MADQQNPIQNDNQTTPAAIPTAADLLGDISLDIPAAPEAKNPAKDISDIGNMLIEQNIDNTQSKSEDQSASRSAAPTDPTSIDLGDINLPANEEATLASSVPTLDTSLLNNTEATIPSATPETPAESMFKAAVTDIPATPVSETEATAASPTSSEDAHVTGLDVSGIEELVTPKPETATPTQTPEVPTVESSAPVVETIIEPVIAPSEPTLPVESSPAIEEPAVVVAPVETPTDISLPVEKSDDFVDSLLQNEQQQVVSPQIQTPAEITPTDDTSFDLDSLTSDLAPKGNESATIEQPAGGLTAANTPAAIPTGEIMPAISSATLPQATLVQPIKSSPKKKAFAMVAAFLMLLVVGGFVFKTMMPEESDKLLASILGGAIPTTEQTTTESPEIATEQSSDIDTLVNESTSNTDDTSALTAGETTIDETTGSDTTEQIASEIPSSPAEISDTSTQTPEAATTTISLGQARTTSSLIANNSKKLLALAIKYEEKQASQILYKVFKDSSYLSETLANTNDISTIPDVEKQITDLQKSLTQASIIVNVAGSKHAGSQ